MENTNRDHKLVFKPALARRLLKAGVPIADIKADKYDTNKTVFVFKRTPEFEAAFEKINAEITEYRAEKESK